MEVYNLKTHALNLFDSINNLNKIPEFEIMRLDANLHILSILIDKLSSFEDAEDIDEIDTSETIGLGRSVLFSLIDSIEELKKSQDKIELLRKQIHLILRDDAILKKNPQLSGDE